MNETVTTGLKARWEKLSPDRKRQFIIVGFIVGFLVLAMPLMSDSPKADRKPASAKKTRIDQLLTGANTRDIGMTGISREVDDVKRMQNELLSEIESLREQLARKDTPAGQDPEVSQELTMLRAEVDGLRNLQQLTNDLGGATPPGAPNAHASVVSAPPPPPVQGTIWDRPNTSAPPSSGRNKPASAKPRMRTIGGSDAPAQTSATAATKKGPRSTVYLPSGSIIQGVLLNGMDAPTGRNASSDPIPVLVRIKHDAIMAGRRKMDLKECHALASGFGDLSSERLYLRSEKISCIRSDGGVIDLPIDMYAVGEDSKAGLRGTLVSKQGAVLSRAMVAGFAEGVSRAFGQNNGPFISSGGVQSGGLSGGELAQSGAYGGASSALDRIAQYYLRMAESMFPVIEVSGGRPITFVVINGVELDLIAAR